MKNNHNQLNVKTIIRNYLKENDYKGLMFENAMGDACACDLNDLAPCEDCLEVFPECLPCTFKKYRELIESQEKGTK